MKFHRLARLAAAVLAVGSGAAADYTVRPKVTGIAAPQSVLLVGNSFMYYNCGVTGHITPCAKVNRQKLVTTMATIGGAGLDWHDVRSYLRSNGLRSYSTLNDGSNKLVFHEYPAARSLTP